MTDTPPSNAPPGAGTAFVMLQLIGLIDVVIGLSIALFGPTYFDGDRVLDIVLIGIGAFLAIFGLFMFWWMRAKANTVGRTQMSGSPIERV